MQVWYKTMIYIIFFFNDTATTEIYTLSLHDALPICSATSSRTPASSRPTGRRWPHFIDTERGRRSSRSCARRHDGQIGRHTSELQSRQYLVCRLLLEKKKM